MGKVSSIGLDGMYLTYSTVTNFVPSRYTAEGQAYIGNKEHSEKTELEEVRHFVCD